MAGSRHIAEVAELADAHDSGSCAFTGVEVQVLSSALRIPGFSFLFWRSFNVPDFAVHAMYTAGSVLMLPPALFLME